MKLLILLRRQKLTLTILRWQQLITSLNLNLSVVNSAYNYFQFDRGNSTLLDYLLKIKMANIQFYLNSLLCNYLRELIYELIFIENIN